MKQTLSILLLLLVIFSSCNSGETNNTNIDSLYHDSPADSMPVVAPPVTDSEAVIKTPPTNDDNVIMPDSSKL
jgi:hypothetical protein